MVGTGGVADRIFRLGCRQWPVFRHVAPFLTKSSYFAGSKLTVLDDAKRICGDLWMKRRTFLASIMLIPFALALSECGDRFPDYSYRMTIYAGDKAFSSVRHVEVKEAMSVVDSGGSTVKRRVQGQAVIIDHNGRTYYALLSRPDKIEYAEFVAGSALMPYAARPAAKSELAEAVRDYQADHGWQDSFGSAAKALQAMVKIKGERDLPRTVPNRDPYRGPRTFENWPLFVTFDDPRNPKTVRQVSPESIGISRVTIEITNDDPSIGIERNLPWLPEYYNKNFSGSRYQNLKDINANGISGTITSGFFSARNGLAP